MPKKLPLRMCTGCAEHRPKKELVRVVRGPDGGVELDLTGRKSGRGAYVCRSAACLQKARKTRRLERALDCPIPEEVYDRMLREMEDSPNE